MLGELPERNVVLLLSTCAFMLAHFVIIWRRSSAEMVWSLLQHSSDWLSRLCCSRPRRASTNEVDVAVAKELEDVKLAYFCSFFSIARCLCPVMIILEVLSLEVHWRTIWQEVLPQGLYGIFLLPALFPGLLTKETVDVWYSVIMAVMCLYIAPFAIKVDYFIMISLPTTVASSIASLSCMRVPIVTVWNCIFVVVMCASTTRLNNGTPWLTGIMAVLMSVYPVFIMASVFAVQQMCEVQIRSKIEAKFLRVKQSAGNALLRVFYDVVAELDVDFGVSSGGEELASFLQSGPGCSTQGYKLEDLLPHEEDRKLCKERLCRPLTTPEAMADVMHVTMAYGSSGRNLHVEIFSFKFEVVGGITHHLLGIREFNDEAVPTPHSCAVEDVSNAVAVDITRLSDARVTVDCLQPSLPVLESSADFQRAVTPVAKVLSLSEIIEDNVALFEWLQHVTNMQCSGESQDAVQRANSCVVWLRPQGDASSRVKATCRLVLDEGHLFEEHDMDVLPLDLSFAGLERVAARSRSSRSSRRSSRGSSGLCEARGGTPSRSQRRSLGRGAVAHL